MKKKNILPGARIMTATGAVIMTAIGAATGVVVAVVALFVYGVLYVIPADDKIANQFNTIDTIFIANAKQIQGLNENPPQNLIQVKNELGMTFDFSTSKQSPVIHMAKPGKTLCQILAFKTSLIINGIAIPYAAALNDDLYNKRVKSCMSGPTEISKNINFIQT